MLKPQQTQSIKTLFPLQTPFLHGNGGHAFLLQVQLRPSFNKPPKVRVGFSSANNIKAVATTPSATENSLNVKAVVTVKPTAKDRKDIQDTDKSLLLELVSAQLDPITGSEKPTVKDYANKTGMDKVGNVTYEAAFQVPVDFGEVGAILVENEHHKEMFLTDVVLDGFPNSPITISCDSWVQSKPDKRVFFTNKSYLPSQTPNGLKRLRGEELNKLQGNGQGERQTGDRIYDYDVYNDIGDPDSTTHPDLKRPVLGGKEHPYPRRCRTGRPRCEKDPSSETRSSLFYVPRDEEFSEVKQQDFNANSIYSVLHAFSTVGEAIGDSNVFQDLRDIDLLFYEAGVPPPTETEQGILEKIWSGVVGFFRDRVNRAMHFKTPDTIKRDKSFWFRDEEFARQTLAGLNPHSLQLVTEWPLKSTLEPETYGTPGSATEIIEGMTVEEQKLTEIIEGEIKSFMTVKEQKLMEIMGGEIKSFMIVKEAIEQKKLFMLDYHDLLLPYVGNVRKLKGTTPLILNGSPTFEGTTTTLYGSRTLFFLTPNGTLRPLAIELTRPPIDGNPQWKRVYTPSWHSTDTKCWLWRLAKAHVLAHDSGYHQLVSHWLRTHCCTEPYIIATNRQLSAMHPIYRLLKPHFRYTMKINALARQCLINAGGIIEYSFSPGKYSMEISSAAYKQWRFDQEALPKDLIKRGLAVEDPSAPHGLKLTIEDNPFAKDGLDLWDAIKQWVTDYVNHYYPNSSLVHSDEELQTWWSEIQNVGHGDKKDEPWWPVLETPEDLIEIITTIVWVASGHHAAVNFGQYTYAGYFPNRPSIARIDMPSEENLENPEAVLLKSFPSKAQATIVMIVLDVLSTHSPDEEYLGDKAKPSWKDDPVINAAFERFNGSLKKFEGIVDERNANTHLKNRNGARIVPYELLKPFSKRGLTGKGVPYSISI